MILNKKGILKQYNIVIYPVDFVVVIGEMEEEVNNLYMPYEEEFKDAHIAPPSKTGCTYRVKERATEIPCIMVWIGKKDECTSSIVTHECDHAALDIFAYIGAKITYEDQEPFCYLAGNLVRLAVGCLYEIPGVKPPVISSDAFEDKEIAKKRKKTSKSKKQ